MVHWLVSVQGLPSAEALAGLAEPYSGHDAYICGPGPFMVAAEEALKAIGAERIHIEVFKSLDSDPFAAVVIEEDDSDEGPATAIVTLDGEKHEITWPRNAKLLDVLLDKGLDAPFSCREGHCGACAVLKKSRRRRDGDQRRARAVRPRRRPDSRLSGQAADPIRSKSPTTSNARATIRGTEGGCRRKRLRRGAM